MQMNYFAARVRVNKTAPGEHKHIIAAFEEKDDAVSFKEACGSDNPVEIYAKSELTRRYHDA